MSFSFCFSEFGLRLKWFNQALKTWSCFTSIVVLNSMSNRQVCNTGLRWNRTHVPKVVTFRWKKKFCRTECAIWTFRHGAKFKRCILSYSEFVYFCVSCHFCACVLYILTKNDQHISQIINSFLLFLVYYHRIIKILNLSVVIHSKQ